MQTSSALAILAYAGAVASQAVTARINAPGSAPASCAASQNGIFGIQVVSSGGSAMKKRQVVTAIADGQIQAGGSSTGTTPQVMTVTVTKNQCVAHPMTQIADGQVQAPMATPITQIGDGQIQGPTGATPVTQIGDGQIQGPKAASPVTQIGDGQIQGPGATPVTQIGDGQIQGPGATPVTQIGDGQIQGPGATPVTQIGDGQIQGPGATPVTQIGDGQIQGPNGTPVTQIGDGQIQNPTGTPVGQIGDGQIQKTTLGTSTARPTGGAASTSNGYAMLSGAPQACRSAGVLEITLNNGVLTDAKGRTGYIAANSQFQFDGPPQAGALYTAGWSLCSNGSLALGGTTTFYQCLSGNFYNLYYENVLNAGQCTPIQIEAVQLNGC